MYLVLCIAQHTTVKLPKDLPFYQLARLTLIAQRYDLNHILIAYLDKWIEPHQENLCKPGFENWLYIAWQFGLVAEYLTLSNHLAVHSEANRFGMLVPSTFGRVLDSSAFPPRTINLIQHCRQMGISDVFSSILSWIEAAFTTNTCKLQCFPQEQTNCTARNAHLFQRYILQNGLFPMTHPERETRSLRQLFDILLSPNLTFALDSNNPHAATCSLAGHIRNEVNSLAGRLIWAVDTDLMNTIRKNGASRALVTPDTILPTFFLGLKTSLGIRDEAGAEANAQVNFEAGDMVNAQMDIGATDEVNSEATLVVQDKPDFEQGHRAVPRDSVMEEARDAGILEEFDMAPFL